MSEPEGAVSRPAMFERSLLPKGHPYHDFRNFLRDVWEHLALPEPTPEQYDMAYWLQHGPKRSISEAFRGFGKSFITAAFACWCWLHDPNYRIMVVSGGGARAAAFSRFALQLLRMMPELQHLAPRTDQLSSLINFEVNGAVNDQSPSCKSVGITGQLTGSRADLIIADDVETPANSSTATQREKLAGLVTEFDALLKPTGNSRITYLGTPQNEDSLYNGLETKGYVARIWPARMPTANDIQSKYGDRLAPYIRDMGANPGDPISIRFGEQDLLERAASYGASGFALQFMLDTSLDDELKYPLKCRDLVVMDVDRTKAPVKVIYGSGPDQQDDLQCRGMRGDRFHRPMKLSEDWTEYDGKMMFVDPAGRGADKTAFAVVNNLRGQLFIRRIGSVNGGYDANSLETLAHVARSEGVNDIRIESNFGDGMFTELFRPTLKRIHPCNVEEIHHTKQKELRIIDTLEPLLNQHRLVIDRNVLVTDLQAENTHSLIYQLTRVCKERGALAHDDALDALAGACAYWLEHLGVDQETSEEDYKREKLDAELDKWLEDITGKTPSRGVNSGRLAARNSR